MYQRYHHSKTKNSIRIFEGFIVKFCVTVNKKDPVVIKSIRRYPFDTQECHVDIVLTAVHDNFCHLSVQNFSYEGDLDLRQYFIRYKH